MCNSLFLATWLRRGRGFLTYVPLVFVAPVAFSAQGGFLFGVNEGTSGNVSFTERQEKYQGLADYLAKAIGTPLKLESAQNLTSLTSNLQKSRYGLLFVRPSHISAKAMRDQHYVLVASAKGDAYTYFLTPPNAPLSKPADVRGKRIVMPDRLAYPTKVAHAMLRDEGINPTGENITYLSSQEAVGFAVEKNLTDVGVVVSYSKTAKEWKAKKNPIVWQSKRLPYWSIIASPKISSADINKLRAALIALETNAAGKKIMGNIGVSGFVAGKQQDYLDLLNWVEQ